MGAGCLLMGSARETLTYERLHFTRFGQRERKLSYILTEQHDTDLIVRKKLLSLRCRVLKWEACRGRASDNFVWLEAGTLRFRAFP